MKSLTGVRLFATPWTVAYQAPPSMRFSRQEYWSGLPFPAPGELPDPGIEPGSPALQVDSSPTELTGEPYRVIGKLLNTDCKVAQTCLTLRDPMDCSPPGSSFHGIFQARILEWVAISLFRGSSWSRTWTQFSHIAGRLFTIWATCCNLAVPMTNINTSGVYHSLRAFQTSV